MSYPGSICIKNPNTNIKILQVVIKLEVATPCSRKNGHSYCLPNIKNCGLNKGGYKHE
jgi:hypothetical protein